MMPTTQEITNQLALLIEMYPDKSTSEIAQMIGYSPVFIINAINYGVSIGFFVEDKKSDKISLTKGFSFTYSDYENAHVGVDIDSVMKNILMLIENLNLKEEDINTDQLMFWLSGVRPSASEIALHILKKTNRIVAYTLTNPYDVKSKYEFLTLPYNLHKKWGSKQFVKKTSKKNKPKRKK